MYVYICVYSNSYWLGEDVPCITYGLRGVIHATVSISNKRADLHSGIEGGAVSELLIDLIHVLGKLVDNNKKVLIPGNMSILYACFFDIYKLFVPIRFL